MSKKTGNDVNQLMNVLECQLKALECELNKQKITKERVAEIQEATKDIAHKIDAESGVYTLTGMVNSQYALESKYLKKQVKQVVRLLQTAFVS